MIFRPLEARSASCCAEYNMNMLTDALVAVIRVYQTYLSPLKGATCRFYPSCSHYSIQSLRKHGLLKGLLLALVRLLKCHPWHPGGYDPV